MLVELRHSVGTPRRKVLVVVTLLLGLLAAVALTMGTPADQRSFATTSTIVQLLMSVTVPFFGVLLTTDRRRAQARLPPAILAGATLAVAFALFGMVATAVATALVSSTVAGGRWQHAGAVAVGSVLVQLIAQLTGTGWGQLVRSPGLAMAATIVVPLGLWLLLGAVEPVRPAREWVTPAANAAHLLSGQMRALNWAQLLVVVLIWDVGLNAYGAYRVSRRRTPVDGAAG